MTAVSETIRRSTDGDVDIIDLTGEVQSIVERSGVRIGQVVVMVVGSTAGITTLEYEPGLVNHDISAAMERVAPSDGRYRHEQTWHDDNGHSHVRAALTGPSSAFPVVDGRIPLGTWQQIVLLDFDTRPRHREIVVSVVGN